MKEKHNNLLIQKDLLENEFSNLKNAIENEKNTNITLVNRLNESEGNLILQFIKYFFLISIILKLATNQLIICENNKLRDKEHFHLNEMLKFQSMVSQLELVSFMFLNKVSQK